MHDLATPMLRDARRAQGSYRVLIWFFPLKLYENDSQEKN